MHRLKFVMVSLLLAPPAFAQDGVPEGEGGETGPDSGGEANPVGAEGTPAPEGEAGATVSAGWSKSATERPFFRAAGKITAGGDFNLLKVSFPGTMGMSSNVTVDYVTLGGAYAITDQISVGLSYALSLGLGDGDFEGAGPLSLWGGYQIKHDAKMSLAATAAFAINTDETDQKSIGIGVGFRYMLTPKIGLFTGGPYGPAAVGGAGFGGGPLGGLFGAGGHLNINLADMGPITLDLPVGGMFQATPELSIHALTSLASIGLSNSPYRDDMGEEKSAFIFGADYIPLSVGALYAVNEMIDVLVNLNLPDLKEVQFDLFVFSAGARVHL